MKLRQQLIKLICAGLLGSLLSGCGLLSGFGTDNTPAPTPLTSYKPSITLQPLWTATVGSGSEGAYLRLLTAYADNRLFTADSSGKIMATDAVKGSNLWRTNIKTAISSGPVVSGNLLILATQDAHIIALNPSTGKTLWRTAVNDEVLAPPTISNNRVLVKSIDGTFTAIDAQSGAVIWTYDHGAPLMVLRASSMAKVVAQNNNAYIGFSDGHLTAVDLIQKTILWDQIVASPKSASEIAQLVDIAADPVVIGNVLYVATYQGRVAAIGLASGEMLWQQDVSSYAGIAVSSKYVVVIDTDSNITAFNRQTGKLAWQQSALEYRVLSAPALFGDELIVGDGQGYLHILNVNDGNLLAHTQIKKEQSIIAPPVTDTANNKIYVLTSAGLLAAYTVK